MAHENSMTERMANGRFVNFTSVVKGKQLSPDEAFRHAMRTGKNLGTFYTNAAAISAAKARSSSFDPSGEIE